MRQKKKKTSLRFFNWPVAASPHIPEGPGFTSKDLTTFHLKLLALRGDHITTNLGFWRLVHLRSLYANLNISEAV